MKTFLVSSFRFHEVLLLVLVIGKFLPLQGYMFLPLHYIVGGQPSKVCVWVHSELVLADMN